MNLLSLLKGVSFRTNLKNIQNIQIQDVSDNSKIIKDNYLFVCIEGQNYDGHLFVGEAIKNGASVIVAQKDLGLDFQVIVENSHLAYGIICQNYFDNPSTKLKLIGVTGTNGKTSTTKIIKHLLTTAGFKVGLIGTIQNEIDDLTFSADKTTPDAYQFARLLSLMVNSNCNYVVMEVSSHALDQMRLGNCKFEVACFTNLTQDHLDYHKTMEDYFSAKLMLFSSASHCIINGDCEYGKRIINIHRNITNTFSLKYCADYYSTNIECSIKGVKFDISGILNVNNINFKMLGTYSVQNALCAVACVHYIEIQQDDIIKGLCTFSGVSGRCEIIDTQNKPFTIICDYAHSPDGLLNLLKNIKPFAKGRIVTLFGCGGDRDKSKRSIMGEIACLNSDFVIVTSDNPRTENPLAIIDDICVGCKKHLTPFVTIENRKQAIFFAIKNALKGDIIILAGKGHEKYQILSSGYISFDEKEIVEQALKDSE